MRGQSSNGFGGKDGCSVKFNGEEGKQLKVNWTGCCVLFAWTGLDWTGLVVGGFVWPRLASWQQQLKQQQQ